jgi:hypothetical protein
MLATWGVVKDGVREYTGDDAAVHPGGDELLPRWVRGGGRWWSVGVVLRL